MFVTKTLYSMCIWEQHHWYTYSSSCRSHTIHYRPHHENLKCTIYVTKLNLVFCAYGAYFGLFTHKHIACPALPYNFTSSTYFLIVYNFQAIICLTTTRQDNSVRRERERNGMKNRSLRWIENIKIWTALLCSWNLVCARVFCLCIGNYFYSFGINFCWMGHEHLRFDYISNGLNSTHNTRLRYIFYTTSKMWMITALILCQCIKHTQLPLWEIYETHTPNVHTQSDGR